MSPRTAVTRDSGRVTTTHGVGAPVTATYRSIRGLASVDFGSPEFGVTGQACIAGQHPDEILMKYEP